MPKVKPDTSMGFQMFVSESNSPNDVASSCCPSIKTTSAKYPLKYSPALPELKLLPMGRHLQQNLFLELH